MNNTAPMSVLKLTRVGEDSHGREVFKSDRYYYCRYKNDTQVFRKGTRFEGEPEYPVNHYYGKIEIKEK